MNNRRIKSSNVQLGESLIIGQSSRMIIGGSFDSELSEEELSFRSKEQEFKEKTDQILADAQRQAASIIDEANHRAAQIIEESQQEAQRKIEEIELIKQQVCEEARLEGQKIGYNEGYQKASEDVHFKVENLEAIASAAFKIKKEIILSAENEILQLAVSIAEKILKQQLEVKPELIIEIIRAAINELKDKEEIKIIINPALKEQMYNFSEELKSTIKGLKKVKIIEDKTIHANSAIIESPESRVDARLDSQIAEITREIMNTFAEEPVLIGEIVEEINLKINNSEK